MSHLDAAPVIATKGYVDSGLASKADLGDFQSFTDFQTRVEGFATAAQGTKADGALPISGGTVGNLLINSLSDGGFSSGLRISASSGSNPLIHFTDSGAAVGRNAGDFTMIHYPASKTFMMGYKDGEGWPALNINTANNSVLLSKDPTEALGAATKRYVDGKQTALTANTNAYDVILGQSAGAAAGVQPGKLNLDNFMQAKDYANRSYNFNSTDFNNYTKMGIYETDYSSGINYTNGPTYGNWHTVLVFGDGGSKFFQLALAQNTADIVQWRAKSLSRDWTEWKVLGRPYEKSLIVNANDMVTVKANPTAALGIATKQYVDDAVAATNGGLVPSWSTLSAASWDNAHWGATWEVKSNDGAFKVSGVGACLSTNTKSGSVPSASTYGANCWCKVSSVNETEFSGGAWVFDSAYGSFDDCAARCAHDCSICVRYGAGLSCSRAALFAAP